ncbi:MAG: zf-HC2 domain-containing protein [Vicinamibacterales bacterium]
MSIRESCEAIEPLLAPFGEPDAAGVMTPDDRARVAAHLAACPPCRAQAEACRAAHDALKACAAELSAPAPAHLAARCRAAAARASAPRRAARWAGWSAAAAAAAAIVLIVLMPERAIATQLAVDHMKCAKFAAGAMTGTPGQLETAWLAKRNHQVTIPAENAADGLQLVGVRRCVSTEGNMAHVMYARHGAPISLFIFKTPGRQHAGNTQVETVGHKAILWTAGQNTYALVGRGQDLSGTAAWMQTQMKNRGR